MKLYHEKTSELLKKNRAKRQSWLPRSPATGTSYSRHPEEGKPVTGQFDDKDLSHDVIDPLKTPTTTPVQDEETAVSKPANRRHAHTTGSTSLPNIYESSLSARGNSESRGPSRHAGIAPYDAWGYPEGHT